MAKQFTLAKDERLKSRKAIDFLFKEGQRFTVSPFRLFYFQTTDVVLQFGAGVSTKNFKKAVDRNKIKRLSREAWRLQKNELQQALKNGKKGLHLFVIYTAKEIPDHQLVFDKMTVILNKLLKLVHENNIANT